MLKGTRKKEGEERGTGGEKKEMEKQKVE